MPIRITAPPSPASTVYNGFRGVDFSSDAIMTDKYHSPDSENMISDKGGLPEKRLGYRLLHTIEQPINGLFHGVIGSERVFIAHGGTKLYRFDENSVTEIKSGIDNSRSTAFFFGKIDKTDDENAAAVAKTSLYILTGSRYLCYDGETVKDVSEIAYIPTVLIAKEPSGGGTQLDAVNMLQKKRIERFAGNGSARVYQLGAKDLDEALVTAVKRTAAEDINLTENTDFTVNRATGQVTFTAAPPVSPVTGEDNVFITYSKTARGYADRISGCTIATHYGLGGSNRIFVSGNKAYRAYDWWSEMNDPTYFPDLNYSIAGSTNTDIVGYAKLGEYLVIIKEDNQQDGTIFIRNASMTNGRELFTVRQGVTGTGGISPYSFVNLIDEPLFLSRTGIYAVTLNMVTSERTLQNRSYFINNRLCKEENLKNAVAAEWNGYYMLALNNRAYLLDSRRKTAVKSNDNAYSYECFLWSNIPARCLLSCDGELFFGTEQGEIFKFNTDIETMDRYSDNGEPIDAYWTTNADDDGVGAMLKTMQKKGGMLTIKPSVQTGAEIYVSVDGEPFVLLRSKEFALFAWENLNFSIFTFLTTDTPKTIMLNQKVKKYSTLQFKIRNSRLNQSFGIFELSKYFTAVNYKKQKG